MQKVFDLVRQHMWNLHEEFPEGVELLEHRVAKNYKGSFPHTRLLGTSESASEALISRISENALDGTLDNICQCRPRFSSPQCGAPLYQGTRY